MSEEMDHRCRREVEDLHRFFADWLSGNVPRTERGFERVTTVLHPGFEIVAPSARVSDREALLESLWKAHGSRSRDGFTIRVDGYEGRPLTDSIHLARYREWQWEGTDFQGRLSSALFRESPEAPHGVAWLHVHEVWLP